MKKSETLIVRCNLDQIIIKLGLKPGDVASLTNLSRPTVYDLIAHRVSPTLQTLTKLANGLGVDHKELLRTEILK